MKDLVYLNPSNWGDNELRDTVWELAKKGVETICYELDEKCPSYFSDILYWNQIDETNSAVVIDSSILKNNMPLLYAIADNCKWVDITPENKKGIRELKKAVSTRRSKCIIRRLRY